MITGHFGLAAGVKGQKPRIPLWALMLATVWLDLLFAPLLALGVEEIVSSDGYGDAIIHADYTHSLVGALVLSALFGIVASRWWGRRIGTVLGAVAFSHWILDLIVHRGDMPVLPGNWGDLPRLGFGLWRVPVASMTVEFLLLAGGAYLYYRAARAVAQTPNDRRSATTVSILILLAGLATFASDLLLG